MKQYDYHHLAHVKTQKHSKKALWITLLLTFFFTLVEIVGGILSNSLALLSDSAHMISDVLALGLSMTAIHMAARNPTKTYTFGFLRFEIIASFINGLALVIIAIGIFIEGIRRILYPETIDLPFMLTVATIGLIVNIVLTYVLSRSTRHEENLNIKSALWHFIGDLLSSIGIIIAAGLIYLTGISLFDPIISLIIGVIIFSGGFKILRESYFILMEAVPEKFDLEEIRNEIKRVDGVQDVHDMHLWTVTTDHFSLTAHIFLQSDYNHFRTVSTINQVLEEKYGLRHNTIQVEHPDVNEHGEYGKS
ncbi:cation diffusion facilitator family transporter [Alteribacillus iranensis]|uniref:Cobalt-zinc-cadmium efflux system protein n=1 Tax=Alteribacillus iranensis TaxID=930128 RepID=A0A1I2EYC2_9BACI|nr:cation diffusion facilitator family transporter [Alteribacillus iranensis]SFE97799.1 cobalt-zinc-cadmium efflux system protein [Alteribacillus iranensis]